MSSVAATTLPPIGAHHRRRQRPSSWRLRRSVTTNACAALATAAALSSTSPLLGGGGGVVALAFQINNNHNNLHHHSIGGGGRAANSARLGPRAVSTSPNFSTSTTASSASGATSFVDLQHSEFSNGDATSNKPPVVLLHGFLGNRRNFATIGRSLASQLEQPRRIVAVDLRNHGDTAKKQDESTTKSMAYRDMAADVVAFLDAQDIPQAVLVGHSMGGKLAQAVSLLHPDRVDGLVVLDIAPVPYTNQDSHWKAVVDILQVLQDIPPAPTDSSADSPPLNKRQVESLLKPTIPDPALRAFLLTNWNAATGDWSIPIRDIVSQIHHLAD